MKRILIMGENSYVGTSFQKYLLKFENNYLVESISVRNEEWKEKDFSKYDVVLHVAGIAHIKETKENANLYYKVNRDLAYEVAKKAKEDGIKQFIFLSSMSVYGIEIGVIKRDTIPSPKSNYGKSKLQAEEVIGKLEDESFKIVVLRPPMIYGKGCKGNYVRLQKFALKSPVFPDIKNKRSMLYIDNLCEFIKLLIDGCSSGLFFPQNNHYMNTSEMVRLISEIHGKKIRLTKLFNPLLKLFNISTVNKVFGDLVYEIEKDIFVTIGFEDTIRLTENNG